MYKFGMYHSQLTNKDIKTLRDELADKYGIKIIFSKEKNMILTPGVNGLNLLVGDFILNGVKLTQLEEAKIISVAYNKLMIDKFGEEYKTNLNLILNNNINEYKNHLNELAEEKKSDNKKQRIKAFINYYENISDCVNGKQNLNEKSLDFDLWGELWIKIT